MKNRLRLFKEICWVFAKWIISYRIFVGSQGLKKTDLTWRCRWVLRSKFYQVNALLDLVWSSRSYNDFMAEIHKRRKRNKSSSVEIVDWVIQMIQLLSSFFNLDSSDQVWSTRSHTNPSPSCTFHKTYNHQLNSKSCSYNIIIPLQWTWQWLCSLCVLPLQ